ncbi:MAG: SDR family NAD(P)-dependent oxidoreductase [Actinomycetota bacterium]
MTCSRKHLLITGTSSGIGKATMDAALEAGYHVFAGDRSVKTNELPNDHDALTRLHLDITNDDDIAATVAAISAHVGDAGLDGLANIAGVGIPGPLETLPIDSLRASFAVDVFGQIALTQPLLPLIRKATGRIIFIGSIGDRVTLPFMGALTAAKSAIASLNDTLRQELAPWGIEVILVEPGFIKTGANKASKALIDKVPESFTPEQATLYAETFKEFTAGGYKTQEAGSPPEDVAAVILNALTTKHPKAHYLTGSKAHLMAAVGKLPAKVQDAGKRKAFGLPGKGEKKA